MNIMLSEEEYKDLILAAEGRNLDAVLCYSIPDNPPEDFSFADRREIFFWVLERLLKDGRIKLAKHKEFLTNTIEEQVASFREALPRIEEDLDDGIWFFYESCPGAAVWVLEDGSLEWT